MKKLLVILPFLSSCGSTLLSDIEIDPELRPYVEEFFADCDFTVYREICDRSKKEIKSIKWGELESNTIGVHRSRTTWVRKSNSAVDKLTPEYGLVRHIVIDPNTPDVRITMYHELGHAIDQDHDDKSCLISTYLGRDKQNLANNRWRWCVDQLFTEPEKRIYD